VTRPASRVRAWFAARSISARLAIVAAIATLTLALAAAGLHAGLTRQLASRVIDPQLEAALNDFMLKAAPDPAGGLTLGAGLADARFDQQGSGRYMQLVQLDGGACRPVWAAQSLYPLGAEMGAGVLARACAAEDPAERRTGTRFFSTQQRESGLRIAARTAQLPGINGRFLVVVGADPAPEVRAVGQSLAFVTAVLVAACALVVMLTAWALAFVGAQPLQRLANDVAAVRRGERESLNGEYPQEIAPLALELNALVAHSREVVERARRHVGNLAHALKTPIAVLRNAVAAGEGSSAPYLGPAVEDMERFVERQLRRARVAARADAATGATIAYQTPVVQNLRDLVFMMEQKYDEKAVDIQLEAPVAPTFRGEREDLLEMAANLMDNACKYGRSEVRVTVAQDRPGWLSITVEDDGPGIDPAQIEGALQRGARLDEAAPGQGLGLSILVETVDLYAGSLNFARSALGGLKATLDLPAVD
jgi:signal transduction histidine kinase